LAKKAASKPDQDKIQELKSQIQNLTVKFEKQIFDLKQLIEISKSLNSTLDYNALIQSILYICMGQLKVLKAGLFVRKDVDQQHLVLHRSQVGFEIDPSLDFTIPEGHPIIEHFHENYFCHTYRELEKQVNEIKDLEAISTLRPRVIVPLKAKDTINGILILGEPINGKNLSKGEKDYVLNIAILAGIAVHNAFLYEVTTTDMMTKLRLKHYFLDKLGTTLSKVKRSKVPLTLIMLDLDNFKFLNDSYGHLMGDEVIQRVAKVLLDNIRQTDLAARYGGEEFVIMLPDTDMETAQHIAERIRLHVEELVFQQKGEKITITISGGIASYKKSRDANSQALIERADKALYDSKKNGKNKVTLAK
jgi:two-component system cell cycle response regulator